MADDAQRYAFFILDQCVALRIKNWHELKETLSETVTVSDN